MRFWGQPGAHAHQSVRESAFQREPSSAPYPGTVAQTRSDSPPARPSTTHHDAACRIAHAVCLLDGSPQESALDRQERRVHATVERHHDVFASAGHARSVIAIIYHDADPGTRAGRAPRAPRVPKLPWAPPKGSKITLDSPWAAVPTAHPQRTHSAPPVPSKAANEHEAAEAPYLRPQRPANPTFPEALTEPPEAAQQNGRPPLTRQQQQEAHSSNKGAVDDDAIARPCATTGNDVRAPLEAFSNCVTPTLLFCCHRPFRSTQRSSPAPCTSASLANRRPSFYASSIALVWCRARPQPN